MFAGFGDCLVVWLLVLSVGGDVWLVLLLVLLQVVAFIVAFCCAYCDCSVLLIGCALWGVAVGVYAGWYGCCYAVELLSFGLVRVCLIQFFYVCFFDFCCVLRCWVGVLVSRCLVRLAGWCCFVWWFGCIALIGVCVGRVVAFGCFGCGLVGLLVGCL